MIKSFVTLHTNKLSDKELELIKWIKIYVCFFNINKKLSQNFLCALKFHYDLMSKLLMLVEVIARYYVRLSIFLHKLIWPEVITKEKRE